MSGCRFPRIPPGVLLAALTALLLAQAGLAAEDPWLIPKAVDAEQTGDYVRALQLWRFLSRTKQTPLAACGEAKICWILNKPAEAKAALETALKRDPKYSPALSLLAKIQLSEGNAESAKANLEKAVAADERNAEAQRLLADLLAHAGELDDAHKHFVKLLELRPDSVHARQNVVAYLATTGKMTEAIQICREGVKDKNAPAKLRLELGHLYLQTGKLADAYDQFKASRETGSHDSEPWQMLAIVCGARGDWVSALNYAQGFCELDPGSVNAMIPTAWAAYGSNDLLEAKNTFAAASAIAPRDADLRNLTAIVLMDLHRWPDAGAQLLDGSQVDAEDPYLGMNRAMLNLMTAKPKDALAEAQEVEQKHPEFVCAKSLLAYMMLANDHESGAEKLAQEVLQLDADDLLAHVVLARVLRQDKKFDESMAQLSNARRTAGGDTSFLECEKADTLLAKGDIVAATTAAQFALQLAPASLDAKHALAKCLEKAGNWDGAALYLRELAARRPKDLAAKLELGNALVHQGDSVAAQLVYEAAQKLAPNSREVLLGLSKVAEMQGNKSLGRELQNKAASINR